MTLRLTFDAETDAAYLRFSAAPVHDSEEVAQGVVIDYDAEGRMVGIEVLEARKHLPADALAAAE
jgi:uncharacterized protein YuzE